MTPGEFAAQVLVRQAQDQARFFELFAHALRESLDEAHNEFCCLCFPRLVADDVQ